MAIDLLRAFAILWVILFHLWGDLEFFPGAPRGYYDAFVNEVRAGGAWQSFTAFGDLFFRNGFQGVPLFMIISGLSLTIAAYRAGDALRWPSFFLQRFRKLLVPYWFGVILTFGVIAAIAWRQVATGHGDSFSEQFTGGVTISLASRISVDWGVAFASFGLVPRLVRDEWFFAPQLALWFVGLLAQYYLLFPLLFLLMRKITVVPFLLLTFAFTVLANVWIVDRYGAPEFQFRMVTGWAPFRLFEFTVGMSLGWLLAGPGRERALAFARQPAVAALAIVLGLSTHTAGTLMVGDWGLRYWQAFALPLATLGLALLALPLLVRRPSTFDVSLPVRALATVGVMSYAVLIINDPLRLVASQLRLEQVSDAVWWTFLVAVYVPVSILLAWPLSRLLGLMPRERSYAIRPAPALEEAPEPAGVAAAEPVPVTARA